jgi:hypothetical protein
MKELGAPAKMRDRKSALYRLIASFIGQNRATQRPPDADGSDRSDHRVTWRDLADSLWP